MYRSLYSLTKDPFGMSPDPSLLYMTGQHREALAGLLYTVLDCKGLAVLIGEAGTGKTTLLRRVLRDLPGDKIPSSIIFNPILTSGELLEMAMFGFGITDIPSSKPRRLLRLQRFLTESHEADRVPLLAVDEAHVLSRELLEEIRLLSNFELADRKLLQIVLIGQNELTALLERDDLRQLKQRIAVRLAIRPLNGGETDGYIKFRWAECGGTLPIPFSAPAVAAIAAWSLGIPRVINSLCDNALIAAFGQGGSAVLPQHIEQAALDLRLKRTTNSTAGRDGNYGKIGVSTSIPMTPIAPVRMAAQPADRSRKSRLWHWATRVGV